MSTPEPYDVTVSETPPTRRQVVAPERSIGSGRYGALRDHDDKHRDDHPDQPTQHGSHALPKAKPWYATGAALVTAGALLLVALSAVAVAALNSGGKDADTADATTSDSTVSTTPTTAPTPTDPPSTPAPTATASASAQPTPSPTPEPTPGDVTLNGTLKVVMAGGNDAGFSTESCWYVVTPEGRWSLHGGPGSLVYYTEQEFGGVLNTATSGIYTKGTEPQGGEGGTPLYPINKPITVTGPTSPEPYRGFDGSCKPAANGSIFATSFGG